MQPNFGGGPPLKETSPWLNDDRERHLRILDVAERNSVIEGLPRFTRAMRERMLKRLASLDVPEQAPPPPVGPADRTGA